MSQFDKMVLVPAVKNAVWTTFEFDNNCTFPNFGEKLLYGSISDIVHNSGMNTISISNVAPDMHKHFFGQLAIRQKNLLREFDGKLAVAYESNIQDSMDI